MTLKESAIFSNNLLDIQRDLRNLAYMLTKDEENASDLLQETNLKILNSKGEYSEEGKFKSWALVVMRNTFINQCKATKQTIPFDNAAFNIADNATFECVYDYNLIMNKINELPKSMKMTFTMYLEGYKGQEIAKRQKINLNTVKSRIFSIRRRLEAVI